MSTIEDDANSKHPGASEPPSPVNKIEKVLEQMQFLSVKNSREKGFDMSNFSSDQIDKILSILDKNEDNAFKYHTKRLESVQSITEKKIDASIVDQKTQRYGLIISLVAGVCITIVILFLTKEYFIPWLTFLTGLLGGFGIGKINSRKQPLSAKEMKEFDAVKED